MRRHALKWIERASKLLTYLEEIYFELKFHDAETNLLIYTLIAILIKIPFLDGFEITERNVI